MNQLSTTIFSHIILFHDKSKKWITEQQFDAILKQSTDETRGISVDGNFITFSSIMKILDKDEYYTQYPDERPQLLNKFIAPTEKTYTLNEIISKRQRAFKGLLIGLKQFIDEESAKGIKTPHATKLYRNKLEKYKQLFGKQYSKV